MFFLTDHFKRTLERWTLLVGGIEMAASVAMGMYPDIFPGWTQGLALGIAVFTIGVGLTLVWSDISKIASLLRLRPHTIGPAVSISGAAIIVGVGLYQLFEINEPTAVQPPASETSSNPIHVQPDYTQEYEVSYDPPPASNPKKNGQYSLRIKIPQKMNLLEPAIRLDNLSDNIVELDINRYDATIYSPTVRQFALIPKYNNQIIYPKSTIFIKPPDKIDRVFFDKTTDNLTLTMIILYSLKNSDIRFYLYGVRSCELDHKLRRAICKNQIDVDELIRN